MAIQNVTLGSLARDAATLVRDIAILGAGLVKSGADLVKRLWRSCTEREKTD